MGGLIGPFPLLIAGLILRLATSLHTLGDVFIWIGAGLLVLVLLLVVVVAIVTAIAGTTTSNRFPR
jgi:hypothetical protein